MHVSVNGVRLFFDVEGAKFVPDGPVMREKPVLLMLHGGPGADHSIYRPAYSALADIAQIVYLDHRGNGRSEDGPQRGLESRAMGRRRARLLRRARHRRSDRARRVVRRHGRTGLRHAAPGSPFKADPDQHRSPRRVIPRSARGTVRALWRPGSRRAGAPPLPGVSRPSGPGLARRVAALAMPLYFRTPRDPDMARRAVNRPEVLQWFTRPGGESDTFNMFPDLHRIQCPTLVMGGEDDPMHPIESQADIAAALPPHLVQFERFANCGHAVVPDAPERAMALLREFILRR